MNPIKVNASSALKVGLKPAIVLSQIESILHGCDGITLVDGNRWVALTLREWKEKYLSFWCEKTIREHLNALETSGHIESIIHEHPRSGRRIKFYRIISTLSALRD